MNESIMCFERAIAIILNVRKHKDPIAIAIRGAGGGGMTPDKLTFSSSELMASAVSLPLIEFATVLLSAFTLRGCVGQFIHEG